MPQPKSFRVTRTCGNAHCRAIITEQFVSPDAKDAVVRRMTTHAQVQCPTCQKVGKTAVSVEDSDNDAQVQRAVAPDAKRRVRVPRGVNFEPAPASRRKPRIPRRQVVPPVAARRTNKLAAMQGSGRPASAAHNPLAGAPKPPPPPPAPPREPGGTQGPRRARRETALAPRIIAADQSPRRTRETEPPPAPPSEPPVDITPASIDAPPPPPVIDVFDTPAGPTADARE